MIVLFRLKRSYQATATGSLARLRLAFLGLACSVTGSCSVLSGSVGLVSAFALVRDGGEALHAFLSKANPRSTWSRAEARLVFLACQSGASVCELSQAAGTVDEEFVLDLQDQIARERKGGRMLCSGLIDNASGWKVALKQFLG